MTLQMPNVPFEVSLESDVARTPATAADGAGTRLHPSHPDYQRIQREAREFDERERADGVATPTPTTLATPAANHRRKLVKTSLPSGLTCEEWV